ncbi:hypothetical protein F383_03424 [Gossypium arboreum]|uniref:Uncharacterized protein n=1 Tax=Gossypium arboreum TaxID=29729 RepID=A0A0B0PCK6_GOSAR|nr:hypothetical protein F383_03424 [Gossypium arboreum]
MPKRKNTERRYTRFSLPFLVFVIFLKFSTSLELL